MILLNQIFNINLKESKNPKEIFPVIEINILIRRNIFHIYSPISWKKFPSINTVKLTARGARDQLNVAYASPLPWPGGPLRAPPA